MWSPAVNIDSTTALAGPHNAADANSAELVAAFTEQGVRTIVCGQRAAYYVIATDDLLTGVEIASSAMTAHVVLQQQGYTLNPF